MKLGRLGCIIGRGFDLERVFSVALVAGVQYYPVWQLRHQRGGSCWATCRPANVLAVSVVAHSVATFTFSVWQMIQFVRIPNCSIRESFS